MMPRTTAANLNQIAREMLGAPRKLLDFGSGRNELAVTRQTRPEQICDSHEMVFHTNRTFNAGCSTKVSRHAHEFGVRITNAVLRNYSTSKILNDRTTSQPVVDFSEMLIEIFSLGALFFMRLFAWHIQKTLTNQFTFLANPTKTAIDGEFLHHREDLLQFESPSKNLKLVRHGDFVGYSKTPLLARRPSLVASPQVIRAQ